MIVIVCPGQGSQTPGFLAPWLELPGLRDQLTALSDAAEVDLVTHGTTSDEDTIKDTAVAQPLIVGAGLLALRALDGTGEGGDAGSPAGTGALAGHSVGEITAAAAAGVLTETDAMRFVAQRGRAMAQASAATPTGMSAVLGGDPDEVLASLERHDLTPANVNGGGQVVAAGALDALAALRGRPAGQGAASSPCRSPARSTPTSCSRPSASCATDWSDHDVSDPGVTLVSNRDGAVVTDGREVLDRLVAQVSQPGALGPVHGVVHRPRRHRPSSSCRRPARSSGSPSGR